MNLNTKLRLEKIAGKVAPCAVIVCLLMYTSLVEQVEKNWHGETLPVANSLLTMLNCTLWTFYGAFKKGRDWAIIVPNVIGFFCGVAVFLTAVFCKEGCRFPQWF